MDTVKTGKYIAECREQAGFTRQELADRLGVSEEAVSKWETGRETPDIGLLTGLAGALHVTADDLLRGESGAPSSPPGKEENGGAEYSAAKYVLRFAVTRRNQLRGAKLVWRKFYFPLRLFLLFAGISFLTAAFAGAGYAAFASRSVPAALTVLPGTVGVALLLLFSEGYRMLKDFRKRKDGSCTVRLMEDGFSVSREGTTGIWRYSMVTELAEAPGLLTVFCGRKAVFLWKESFPTGRWEDAVPFLRAHCAGAEYTAASKRNAERGFSLFFACAALLVLLFQTGYLFLHAKYDVAYQAGWVMYLINFAGILFAFLSALLLAGKRPAVLAWVGILCGALTIADVAGALSAASGTQDFLSVSPDGRNELILKRNIPTGKTVQYRDPFLCFARPGQQLPDTVYGRPKIQWLAGDVCAVTYLSEKNGSCHQMVATFGGRGRSDFYYVEAALDGSWEPSGKNTAGWKLVRDTGGIVLSSGGREYSYSTKDCVQYGLTALVLCKNQKPQWTVTLNEDCRIDPRTLLVSSGGTLTLCRVSMDPAAPLALRCTSKSLESGGQRTQTSEKNACRVRNGVLSFTWDYGHRWTALDLSSEAVASILKNGSSTELADGCWYVSDNFSYVVFGRAPLMVLFTPNQGKTWETHLVAKSVAGVIASRYVVYSGNGAAAVAVGLEGTHDYKGSLLYTTGDAGDTWQSRKVPSTQTLTGMNFLSPETGYLSYTDTAGDQGELYETTDGGKTFTRVILPAGSLSETGNSAASGLNFGQVYDTPQVPHLENGIPVLYVTQGSDGDFGTYRARYESKDGGKTWRYVAQEKTPPDSGP